MRAPRPAACILAVIGLLATAASAAAQPPPPPAASSERSTFVLSPTFSITDLGLDTNVFSTPDERADTIGRFTIGADPSARLGRVDLHGRGNVSLAYYRQYSDQRSVDTDDMGRIDVRLNRVTLFGSGSVLRTGNALSAELDVRTKQLQTLVRGGTDVRLSDRTVCTAAVARSTVKYDSNEFLYDASVSQQLNRVMTVVSGDVRTELTPLTAIAVLVDVQRDRFEFSTIRDTRSYRGVAGFEFKPSAVIDGKAYAGYRVFDPLDPAELSLGTVVASADVGYTLMEAWRFDAGIHRDLAHSYSLTERYYVATELRGTVTRRITPEWDVVGMIGRQDITYRYDWSPAGAGTVPTDHLIRFGAGVLYRFGHTSTFGVNLESYRRDSTLSGRYDRTRLVTSVGVRF